MSRVPMGSDLGEAGWSGFSDKLLDQWQIVPQGISAEVIAEEWGLSREELDAFSYESHMRAVRAIDEGRFENEIVPIEVPNPHAGVLFAVDETPGATPRRRRWRRSAPAFKEDGVVTAANSSQIVDGSAAMLVGERAAASELGLEPRARFVSFGLAGVDPYRMLHGNPKACCARAREGGADLGRHRRDRGQRGVRFRRAPVPEGHGAARALGGGRREPERRRHLARSPARRDRCADHGDLLNELDRRDARYGVATMCIGQGQAIAAVIERFSAK